MPTLNTDRYVWIDLETFGLNPQVDPILEIGFVITDIDLNVVDDFQRVVWESGYYDAFFRAFRERAEDPNNKTGAKFVLDMHTKSGLWDDATQNGITVAEAESDALDWLRGHGVDKGDPICGSSLRFDRDMLASWMRGIDELFSYRVIDVSSFKESMMRENPAEFEGLDGGVPFQAKHRVLPDIADTINEYRWYRENYLRTAYHQ